jgi:hypothetical protein
VNGLRNRTEARSLRPPKEQQSNRSTRDVRKEHRDWFGRERQISWRIGAEWREIDRESFAAASQCILCGFVTAESVPRVGRYSERLFDDWFGRERQISWRIGAEWREIEGRVKLDGGEGESREALIERALPPPRSASSAGL